MATDDPWYGYRCITVMCPRAVHAVNDCEVYRVLIGQRKELRDLELRRLFQGCGEIRIKESRQTFLFVSDKTRRRKSPRKFGTQSLPNL